MTEQEAREAGRGVWRMRAGKTSWQKSALVAGEGLVRAAGRVTGLRESPVALPSRCLRPAPGLGG
jgi:hypothetical protein